MSKLRSIISPRNWKYISLPIVLYIFLSLHCMKIQYSPLDTSQPGIAGIIALVVPGMMEEIFNTQENGLPGIRITETGGTTTATEGGAGDSYSVVLTSQPTSDVTIAVNADAQVRVNGLASVNLVFTSANWNTTQTVTVTAVDDTITEGAHTGTISQTATSADANYNAISVASVSVSITDNDFLLSTIPVANATNVPPCTGNPCRASIVLRFDQSMNTGITPTLVTELANGGTTYAGTPNTNTEFVWTATSFANDTLTINISWYWFPETSRIRYTLSNIENQSGIPMASLVRIFTTTGSGQVFAVKDTGQTLCYNNSGTQACGNATFPGQDGDYVNVPAARSFTGPTAHGTFGTDYSTIDNVTGIRFASCSVGQSGAGCTGTATTMSWETAVNTCSSLNVANSGSGYWGITRWRLATVAELGTIINHGVSNPAIDTANFPNTASSPYWGAGSYENFSRVRAVRFSSVGYMNDGGWDVKSTNSHPVRCVASPASVTTSNYVDNADGTISDTLTGLRWQKCSMGQNALDCSGTASLLTWSSGLQYCNSLNLASRTWRLPNINELLSARTTTHDGWNPAIFPNVPSGSFQSSTSDNNLVKHGNMYNFAANPKTSTYNTRCVSTD